MFKNDFILSSALMNSLTEHFVHSVNGQKKNYLSDWNQYGTLTSERKSLGLLFVWSLIIIMTILFFYSRLICRDRL